MIAFMETTSTEQFTSEAACAAHLAGLWSQADMPCHWPCHADEAVQLLRGAGYDCTIGLLESWCRSGQIGSPKVRASRFELLPTHVFAAIGLCEVTRRWITTDGRHIHKLTAVELAEAQARAIGESVFEDSDQVDCQSLLGVISGRNGQDPEFRALLCTALASKLRTLGVLDR